MKDDHIKVFLDVLVGVFLPKIVPLRILRIYHVLIMTGRSG